MSDIKEKRQTMLYFAEKEICRSSLHDFMEEIGCEIQDWDDMMQEITVKLDLDGSKLYRGN